MVKVKRDSVNEFVFRISDFVSKNKTEVIFLIGILLLGAFLRLYKIDQYMTFLGDEGRDAIIVRRLLVNFDPILIGPGTSIGNMYLGPIYYYLIAPFLLLANFSPVGPSVFIALLGVATIFFVWFVVRDWFPKGSEPLEESKNFKGGALIAALLYGISPVVIIYSRSSWNPNIMPFFSLLTIYSIWKWWFEKKLNWILVTAISMGFVLQSHYLGLLLIPIIAFFWILSLLKVRGKRQAVKEYVRLSILSIGIFAILMSPLVLFDARHGWKNFSAIKTFFLERQTTVSARPWSGVTKLPQLVFDSNLSVISAKNIDISWIITYSFFPGFLLIFLKNLFHGLKVKTFNKELLAGISNRLDNRNIASYFLLAVWIFFAYMGLSLYKQHIYDHYFGFFFTVPFLVVGAVTNYVFQKFSKFAKALFILFMIYTVYINLADNPLKYPPNKQMQRAADVAQKIRVESGNEKMNLAVIAERNYEDGYQYFLEKWNTPVIDIDPLKYEETLANQLFVVCEIPKEKCDPTHNPKAQVANFGWSEIEGEWQTGGIWLYKLTHRQ